jgi:GT2 family glycosyltransferase
MASPTVLVVVVNWNRWGDTEECVRSVRRAGYSNFSVTVVDNGSAAPPPPSLARDPCTRLLLAGSNLGFAAANNVAIREGLAWGADYFWCINNDAACAPGALGALVAAAEGDERLGALGSRLVLPGAARATQALGGGRIAFGRPAHITSPRRLGRLQYICGASVLLRARALREVGLFDERYFLYWEDADLCLRLRSAGWRIAFEPGSLVFHRESSALGKSSPVLDFYFNRSAALFFRRHSRFALAPILLGAAGRVGKRLARLRLENALASVRGIGAGLRPGAGRMGAVA